MRLATTQVPDHGWIAHAVEPTGKLFSVVRATREEADASLTEELNHPDYTDRAKARAVLHAQVFPEVPR